MPEHIKREAVIKDIEDNVIFTVRGGAKLPTAEMRGANKVIDRIKNQPTADVVEVVRCKDCIYFQPNYVLTNDGERRPYTDEEKEHDFGVVNMEKGINCGSRCERYEKWEENNIPVWCNENDFCSYGKRGD